jgi:hypothetical protein
MQAVLVEDLVPLNMSQWETRTLGKELESRGAPLSLDVSRKNKSSN